MNTRKERIAMKACNRHVKILGILILYVNVYGWSADLSLSEEVEEVIFTESDGIYTLLVHVYENGLVDVAISTESAEIIYFRSVMSYAGVNIMTEPFTIQGNPGIMILLTIWNGSMHHPLETYGCFVSASNKEVHTFDLNDMSWSNHYDSMLDIDGDNYYDHLLLRGPFLYFSDEEIRALQTQCLITHAIIPTFETEGLLVFSDNTLTALTASNSLFRDQCIEAFESWLEASAELCESHQNIRDARSKVWAFKEALLHCNYDILSDLYREISV